VCPQVGKTLSEMPGKVGEAVVAADGVVLSGVEKLIDLAEKKEETK
jgi:hypothetical protein